MSETDGGGRGGHARPMRPVDARGATGARKRRRGEGEGEDNDGDDAVAACLTTGDDDGGRATCDDS